MRLFYIVFTLFFVLQSFSSALNLTNEEKIFLSKHPVIKVSNELDWPPFDFNVMGKPSGYSIELLELIAKKAGVELEFVSGYKWEELWQRFEDKKIDIIHPVAIVEYRKKFGKYSSVIYNGKYAFVTKKKTPKINNIKELFGKKLASTKDWAETHFIEERYPEIKLILTKNNNESMKLVQEGKAYATFGNRDVFSYIFNKNSNWDLKINSLFQEYNKSANNSLYFLTRKDWELLHIIFEKAYKDISKEELDKLYKKWFSFKEDKNNLKLTLKEKKYIEENPIVLVNNSNQNYPPFDYKAGGKRTGFSIDLIKLLVKKIGLEIKYVDNYDWNKAFEAFKENKVDLLLNMAKTPQRKEIGIFSNPYFKVKSYFFTKKGLPKITSVDMLENKTVAVRKGWVYERYFRTNYPKIKLFLANSQEEMVLSLQENKADAAVLTYNVMKFFLKKNFIDDVVENEPFYEFNNKEHYLHFFAHKNEKVLVDLLNKALDSLTPIEVKKLENKWIVKNDINKLNEVVLTQEEKKYIRENRDISLCVTPNWIPYSDYDGKKIDGMAKDFVDIIKYSTDIHFKIPRLKSWKEVSERFKNNNCDVVSLLKNTKAREKYLNFTKPLIYASYVVTSTKEKFFIDNFEDIKDKVFVVGVKSAAYYDLKRLYPDIKLIPVETFKDALEIVDRKEAYGFIDTSASISFAIQKHGYLNFRIISKLAMGYDLAFGVKKEKKVLFNIINKTLNSIPKSKIKEIYNERVYFNESKKIVDYSLIWKIVLIGFVFISLILYWNFKITRTNKLLKNAKKEIEEKNEQLEILATTDKLTGLYNRAKIDKFLLYEINRTQRNKRVFSIAILDIDFFKNINDTHGHQVGDIVLKELAYVLEEYTRKIDFIGRWGGEEFMIISPETNKDGTINLCENLRKKVESYCFSQVGNISISIGTTSFIEGDNTNSIVKRADDALYKAKKTGRNKVIFK